MVALLCLWLPNEMTPDAASSAATSDAEEAQTARRRRGEGTLSDPADARAELRRSGEVYGLVPCSALNAILGKVPSALRKVPWRATTAARGSVSRLVRCADSVKWMRELDSLPRRCHVVTSLPDISEFKPPVNLCLTFLIWWVPLIALACLRVRTY